MPKLNGDCADHDGWFFLSVSAHSAAGGQEQGSEGGTGFLKAGFPGRSGIPCLHYALWYESEAAFEHCCKSQYIRNEHEATIFLFSKPFDRSNCIDTLH